VGAWRRSMGRARATRAARLSYTGILWCFGLSDRPWPPERKVFGSVRYMSSENTARKFDLKPYYASVEGLPTIAEARSGRPA